MVGEDCWHSRAVSKGSSVWRQIVPACTNVGQSDVWKHVNVTAPSHMDSDGIAIQAGHKRPRLFKQASMNDPAQRLPPETFALVLSFLGPPSLCRSARVSKGKSFMQRSFAHLKSMLTVLSTATQLGKLHATMRLSGKICCDDSTTSCHHNARRA